jgi:hypothetical protein
VKAGLLDALKEERDRSTTRKVRKEEEERGEAEERHGRARARATVLSSFFILLLPS